jgi:hypothetical protein
VWKRTALESEWCAQQWLTSLCTVCVQFEKKLKNDWRPGLIFISLQVEMGLFQLRNSSAGKKMMRGIT